MMRKVLPLLAVALTLFMGSAAHAQSIDFGINTGATGGSLTFAGDGAALVGTNLVVTNVFGIGTSPSTNLPVTGGDLDFTTSATGTGASLMWGSGGSFSINGAVPGAGIPASTLLASGSFTSLQIIPAGAGGSPTTRVVAGFVLSTVNATLLSFYNLPNFPAEGTLNVSFQPGTVAANGAFTSVTVGSGDFTMTPIPEPSSMILLGIGAVGAFVGYRRRLKVAA